MTGGRESESLKNWHGTAPVETREAQVNLMFRWQLKNLSLLCVYHRGRPGSFLAAGHPNRNPQRVVQWGKAGVSQTRHHSVVSLCQIVHLGVPLRSSIPHALCSSFSLNKKPGGTGNSTACRALPLHATNLVQFIWFNSIQSIWSLETAGSDSWAQSRVSPELHQCGPKNKN